MARKASVLVDMVLWARVFIISKEKIHMILSLLDTCHKLSISRRYGFAEINVLIITAGRRWKEEEAPDEKEKKQDRGPHQMY